MRVAIVSGLCVEHDAISNAVRLQRQALLGAGHQVTVFSQNIEALDPADAFQSADPWWMHNHPNYAQADLVILHHGIHYSLFDDLVLTNANAARVVHFHNVTPPELLTGRDAQSSANGLNQISIASRADAVWCDSIHNADVIASHADIHPDDVIVFPLCVPQAGAKTPQIRSGDRFGVLSVGRLVPAKGLRTLLKSYARLPAELRSRHPLRFIGRARVSDPGFTDELHALAATLGVADDLSIEESLDDSQLALAYSESAVLVSASEHEGFCVPIIEALAAGCAVVASNAGALPDTVGPFGEIQEVGDEAGFASAIERALSSSTSSNRPHDEEAISAYLSSFSVEAWNRRTNYEAMQAVRRRSSSMLEDTNEARSRFAPKQQRLIDRLGCPTCSRELAASNRVEVSGATASAELRCEEHELVGVVDQFRPGFLPRNLEEFSVGPDGTSMVDLDLGTETTNLGGWIELPEGIMSSESGDSITFSCSEAGFQLEFVGHDWSGQARVEVEGAESWDLDVFRENPEPVILDSGALAGHSNRVSISPTAKSDDRSQGAQVVVSRIRSSTRSRDCVPPSVRAVNRGNPYPQRFIDLVAEQLPDAMILDCGGGDRRYGDDRVFNLEYMDFSLPDFYGDGLALPLQDDSFDLIMSQAVLEHVPDPQLAVDEMVRILKPGGLIYFEIAFMQPLHAVPSHYMNVTPHGIEHLCRALEVVDKGEFGGLSVTMEWIGGLMGAPEKIGQQRFDDVLGALADLDAQLSPEELQMAASAVYLLGRKPE